MIRQGRTTRSKYCKWWSDSTLHCFTFIREERTEINICHPRKVYATTTMENLVYGHWIASAVKMRRGLWNLEKYSLFQGTYSSKYSRCGCIHIFPDSKIYGANMGPRWAPCWPHDLGLRATPKRPARVGDPTKTIIKVQPFVITTHMASK